MISPAPSHPSPLQPAEYDRVPMVNSWPSPPAQFPPVPFLDASLIPLQRSPGPLPTASHLLSCVNPLPAPVVFVSHWWYPQPLLIDSAQRVILWKPSYTRTLKEPPTLRQNIICRFVSLLNSLSHYQWWLVLFHLLKPSPTHIFI